MGINRRPVGRAMWPALVILSTLMIAPPAASAHGVSIEIELREGSLELEFTDETGETCAALDVGGSTPLPATVVVRPVEDGRDLLALALPVVGEEVCGLVPIGVVARILADTDAHVAEVRDADGRALGSGALHKPLPPGFEVAETEVAEASDDGPDRTLVFVIGAAVGVGVAVVRRRRR